MKQTKFVQVKSEVEGYGFGKGMKMNFPNVEEIIQGWIEQGWDYCGFVPLTTRGTGDMETISLIFTKEK